MTRRVTRIAGADGRRRVATVVLAAVAIVTVVAVVWALVPRGEQQSLPVVREPLALSLTAPGEIDAGEEWSIDVAGVPPAATAVETILIGPWGAETLPVTAIGDGSTVSVTVPATWTTRSGHLVAALRAGGAFGRIGVDVAPGTPIDGATPLAGPRSVIADLEHWTMVTALPRDRFGNVIADGSPVTVFVRRPNGVVEEVTTEVADLLAHVRVFSKTEAGRTTLRIGALGATGSEVEVLEVPGPPVSVTLVGPDTPIRADGRMLVTLTTDLLSDRYGNVLLDGTEATARIDGPSGAGTVRAVTIDGRAELVVEAPPRPGTLTVRLTVDGVESAPLELQVESAVSELPVALERVATGEPLTRVVIGPVLTTHGGFVPDGTVAVVSAGGARVGVDLRDGMASIEIEADPGSEVRVDVLGTTVRETAP